MVAALLQFGDYGVETAGKEAKVEHLAVREAVEELVQPLEDDRPVEGEFVELGIISNGFPSFSLITHIVFSEIL